jgi:hypothetical protein
MQRLETLEVEIRQARQGSVAQDSNNVEPLVFKDVATRVTESRSGPRMA